MDFKDIKAIVDLMKKNSISEFELEKEEFKIRLKRGHATGPVHVVPDEVILPAANKPAALQHSHSSGGSSSHEDNGEEIKSPMIGTQPRIGPLRGDRV